MTVGRSAVRGWTARLVLVCAVIGAGACGRSDTAIDADARSGRWIRYHLTGGPAGYDVVFEIELDGIARYRRRRPQPETAAGRLTKDESADLAAFLATESVVALDAEYAPSHRVVSPFVYTIEWWPEHGDARQVVAEDGAELPAAFVELRERIAVFQRRVVREGRGGQ